MVVRVLAVLVGLAVGLGSAAAEERIALVIGNAGYAHVPDLANPLNDAGAVQAALEETGFAVRRIVDGDYDDLRVGLADFGRRAARADVAVIYFAGHGVEVENRNYLIPVDAELSNTRDLPFQAVPLDLFRRAAQPAARLSLVIVDACRNNPFLARMQGETRALSRGLARVEAGGRNELVAFAARAGTVAADGAGANSPYAEALAQALTEPGLEIGKLFRRVRDRVRDLTGGAQEPATYGSLSEEDFYFVPPREGAAEAAAPRAADPETRAETAFWESIADSEDPRDFEGYLRRFPDGLFAGLAGRRLARLQSGAEDGSGAAREAGGGGEAAADRRDTAGPDSGTAPEQDSAGAEEPPRVAARPDPAAEAAPAFRPGRDRLRDAQARLNILGHDAGAEDGLMGRRTAAAIARFRAAEGLPGGETLTRVLLERLEAAVPDARLAAHRRDRAAPEPTAATSPDTAAAPAQTLTVEIGMDFRSQNAWRGCNAPVQSRAGTLRLDGGEARTRIAFSDINLVLGLEAAEGEGGWSARLLPRPEGQAPRAPVPLALPGPGESRTETLYLDIGSTARPACGSLIATVRTRLAGPGG